MCNSTVAHRIAEKMFYVKPWFHTRRVTFQRNPYLALAHLATARFNRSALRSATRDNLAALYLMRALYTRSCAPWIHIIRSLLRFPAPFVLPNALLPACVA